MTNGIFKSIKEKDKLYKKLVTRLTLMTKIAYANLKAEFTNYKKIPRRSINEAKHLYYTRTFALYKNDIKQTWSVIKNSLQRKRQCKPTEKFSLSNRIIRYGMFHLRYIGHTVYYFGTVARRNCSFS